MSNAVVDSSGNVFIDLGYPPDETAILQMRADHMVDLRKFIKTKKLAKAKLRKSRVLVNPGFRT